MHNFLDPLLLPKVTTKCSAMDRYEVENLISPDFLVKSRGFIAYTTMKPPTDIDFQLICNIGLSHILISTRIGAHRSSGIEVFVRNSNGEFVAICKAIFEGDGVIFCNSKYYSKNKQPPVAAANDYHLCYFRSNEFRAFINTDFIRIRILRTNGTVPCLGAVEIWGYVSRSCSQETAQTIRRLLNKKSQTSHSNDIVNDLNKIDCEKFEIPDDFKDSLTYELMAIPMTLPSGHTIDQSTLEKCLATDASCGRHGCDPFTGLKYTNCRKPVLNVALKTRIDMFLLKNSHLPEIYSVKRTLGRSSDYQLVRNNIKTNNSTVGNYSDITQVAKKIKIDSCSSGNVDLDDAVNKVMNNKDFVRFTSVSFPENTVRDVNCCAVCDKKENLYVLPCKHFYCRDCSLKVLSKDKCRVCDIEISRSDFQKYHS